MALPSGTKLGPYEILSPIGAGGMGEVYRARDSRLGREVALKVLPDSFARDQDRLHRFEQEARAVAALNHPSILAIHDIGDNNGAPYIVSELLDGNSLRVELESGPLSARKASDYAAQIAQGLAAAHEKDIVHRDLKPENVFVTKEGRVKILDFGLAKLIPSGRGAKSESDGLTLTSSPTEAGMVMGTAGYMAPEQVRGAGVDSRTDIFAFGAVLYEMVSGQRAFRRDTAAETMTAILKEDPPELSEMDHPVSPGLERIVRRCLEKKPEQRFQSAKDLAFALEALSGATTKTSAHAAMAATKEKPRWIGFAAVAAVALAVGAAIVWALRPAPAPPPTFARVSFHRGEVIEARFAPDGKAVIYSARLNGGPIDTYVIRDDYPEPVAAGLHSAALLGISRQGQMAVLVRPQYIAHRQWRGTLATSPISGGAPRELLENVAAADWSADGNDLAVIVLNQLVSQVQYPIGKILLDAKNRLSDLRVSPDGQQVAFFRHPANGDDRGDVVVVDRAGHARDLSTGWESLEGLTWSPSGKEVWFSAAESGEQYCIRAVNLSGKKRTVYCGMSPTLIHDISPSGRVLVSSEDHKVSMAMVEHGKTDERDLSWLDSPYWPRLAWDGSVLSFTDQSEHSGSNYSVYVRKTDGSPAVRIGEGGFATDLTPDGKWALVLLPGDPTGRVQIVPVGPGQTRVLHWDGIQPMWADWFPDGQHILLEVERPGQDRGLFLTDVDGTTPKLLTNAPHRLSWIAPDGQSLLHRQDKLLSVYSIPANTSKPIPGIQPDEIPIGWASDGKSIFTQAETGTGLKLYRVNVESGQRELWQELKPAEQIGLRPMTTPTAITPDGRWIAFTYSTQLGQLYQSDSLK